MIASKDKIPVITIDGPSGSGKGTLAAMLARHYGFVCLDSGALYRLTALHALNTQSNVAELAEKQLLAQIEPHLADLARSLPVEFVLSPEGESSICLAGVDVSRKIREEHVGNLASQIAALPQVRDALLARQRAFAATPGLVADGRDMGTVVFPEAPIKFFLTASSIKRAERRLKQLQEKGIDGNLAEILSDIEARDLRDASRSVSPLVPALDAYSIDSSAQSIADVFAEMKARVDVWMAAQHVHLKV